MNKLSSLRLIWLVLFFINASFFSVAQVPSLGVPNIEHFAPEEYRAGILNYQIVQDQRGFILVANNKGLLEYDGTNWRLYKIGSNNRVRCILPHSTGKIFIGSQSDLGYLWPDMNGRYIYHSLKHLVPTEHADFSEIWTVQELPEGIVFTSVEGLLIYDGSKIDFVSFMRPNMLALYLNDKVFNQVMDNGLMELQGDRWILSPKGDFFANKEVRSIHVFDEKYDLISTFGNGLYLRNMHEVVPWAVELKNDFITNKVLCAERLSGGEFAIGTNNNGLYILNRDGTLKMHLSKGSGLNSKTVLDIFQDSFGNIWIGQNNGISKIEWNSPFRFLNDQIGLSGTGYSVCATDQFIYFGTNNGLYYLALDSIRIQNAQVSKINGIEGVYSIQNINGDILVGCHIGAYQITGSEIHEISGGVGWWTFVLTKNPNIAIGGGYAGLFLLKRINGKWIVEKHYPEFFESSRVMAFDTNYRLWMSHGNKGVYSFEFTNDYDSITKIQFYDQTKGFPSNQGINLQEVNSRLIFTSTDGAYQYDLTSDSMLPYDGINQFIGEETNIRYLAEDNFGDLFYISSDSIKWLKKNNWGYEIVNYSLSRIHSLLNDDLERISILDNNKVLFASREGFIQFDKTQVPDNKGYDLAIRSVSLTKSDSTLFDGNFLSDSAPVNYQPLQARPNLNYNNNSIRFEFSALSYDEMPAQYKFRLVGLDDEWSSWSRSPVREYMNLTEGDYTFEVLAKNSVGYKSNLMQYHFTIHPPWYRQPWLMVIFGLGIVSMSVWLVFFNRKNKKIISIQERDLKETGQKLKEVSEKSVAEINRLKTEKMKDEIRLKKNQLTKSAMSLMDRNDFINQIQKSLNEVMSEAKSTKAKAKLKRLISDIEKNKKDNQDWNEFEILFNETNDNFTRKVKERFPSLSSQEIRLCIYLRMNLNIKEVANLTHVSPRAVEMARHRLRKKLGLSKEDNLLDIVMKI